MVCPDMGTNSEHGLPEIRLISINNNNNVNLTRPTSAEPEELTKTTLHKKKYQPRQYSQ